MTHRSRARRRLRVCRCSSRSWADSSLCVLSGVLALLSVRCDACPPSTPIVGIRSASVNRHMSLQRSLEAAGCAYRVADFSHQAAGDDPHACLRASLDATTPVQPILDNVATSTDDGARHVDGSDHLDPTQARPGAIPLANQVTMYAETPRRPLTSRVERPRGTPFMTNPIQLFHYLVYDLEDSIQRIPFTPRGQGHPHLVVLIPTETLFDQLRTQTCFELLKV